MLNQPQMQRLVDMQHRSYLLLKWVAKAVAEGFVNFDTAHDYSTLPEAAEGWILGHYSNIPDNARPPRDDLPAFCAFFSTYLTNSFDFISNPGRQLYSPDAHCFCPMCSWLVAAPNLIRGAVLSDQVKNLDWKARRAKLIEKLDSETLAVVVAKLSSIIQ